MFEGWLDGLVKYYDEVGRDYLPDLGRGGAWRATGTADYQYIKELRMLDDFLKTREDVIGAAVYAIGTPWDKKWVPYIVNDFWGQLVREQESWEATWEKLWYSEVPQAELGYPFSFPTRITATFSKDHWGIDLAAPQREEYAQFHGAPILASHSGVLYFGDWHGGGYGLYGYIKGERWHTLYGHLADRWPGVRYGDFVSRGQPIGKVGYSGYTRPLGLPGTHLHFGGRPLPLDTSTPTKGYVDVLPHLEKIA
jgi:murein DD-endopeptidase MepM/ murein hydrolase activator NlpD